MSIGKILQCCMPEGPSSLHKKECKKLAAEMHDEQLFKEPPPPDDCPICFLTLQYGQFTEYFHACCGKTICAGCIISMRKSEGGANTCAFCRTPVAKDNEEQFKRMKKLTESGNAIAINYLGMDYGTGNGNFLAQDYQKANELYLKAGELGCDEAYYNLGIVYRTGLGVEIDMKKSKYFYELAAIMGNVKARHSLGTMERHAGNYERALKHYIISARAGYDDSLDKVRDGFIVKLVTKDEYANTLRAYQKSSNELKSDARDNAKALFDRESI